jgi:hypothetical protein
MVFLYVWLCWRLFADKPSELRYIQRFAMLRTAGCDAQVHGMPRKGQVKLI